MARPVFIVDGSRTPFLKARSGPGPFTPVDLAVQCGRPLLARQPFSPDSFDQVILGCVNVIADEVSEGRQFLAGTKHEGILEGYPVRFFEVPKARYAEFLGSAMWAYEGDDFPAVQLVWPDKQGRWPWDPDARERFSTSQPVLGRPTA